MFGKGGTYMDEQKQELHNLINQITDKSMAEYLLSLIKKLLKEWGR